ERGSVEGATAAGRPRGLIHSAAGGPHEHAAQRVVGLDAATGPEHDALERGVDDVHRHAGHPGQPAIEAPQEATATHEMDALLDHVLRQLGRRLPEALHYRRADAVDEL